MKIYEAPKFSLVEITEDIIATSGGLLDSGAGDGDSSDFGDWGV